MLEHFIVLLFFLDYFYKFSKIFPKKTNKFLFISYKNQIFFCFNYGVNTRRKLRFSLATPVALEKLNCPPKLPFP